MSCAAFQFATIQHPRILVLGDLILDRYTFGNAERVSPEAPVLVLRADAHEVRLGGAASVAFLLKSLEAEVTLAGVIGDDPAARTIQNLVADAQIDDRLIRVDPDRPTTTKERFVGRAANRHPHQMLRVDSESREAIAGDVESELLNDILNELPDYDAVLVSDYAKGVCTFRLLGAVINTARASEIPVIVDPARIVDYSRYSRATLIKPNRAEAELATGSKIQTPQDALFAAKKLCWKYEYGSVLVTLDQQGMALFADDDFKEVFPSTEPHEVYDITGAGDMVLAALGLCVASDISLADSVRIANAAAGLEVERLGVAPITRQELARVLLPIPPGENQYDVDSAPLTPNSEFRTPNSSKIVSHAHAAWLAEHYRAHGNSVVFTNGCFDLLHIGHLTTLQEAAALGDALFVAINGDASVRALKGDDRPIIPQEDRASLVAALTCVDHVLIFDEPTPHTLLAAIRPDVLVKGATTTDVVGHEVVEAYGGRVCCTLNRVDDASTTAIVSRIHDAHPPPSVASRPAPGGQDAASQVAIATG